MKPTLKTKIEVILCRGIEARYIDFAGEVHDTHLNQTTRQQGRSMQDDQVPPIEDDEDDFMADDEEESQEGPSLVLPQPISRFSSPYEQPSNQEAAANVRPSGWGFQPEGRHPRRALGWRRHPHCRGCRTAVGYARRGRLMYH